MDIPRNFASDDLTEYMAGFSFDLHAFGHQFDNPQAVCSNRITGDFELICLIGGQSRITVADTTYHCRAGDAILIPPFTLHHIQTTPEAPHNNFWIHFDVNPVTRQTDFIRRLTRADARPLVAGEDVPALFRFIEKELLLGQPGRLACCTLLLSQILILLLRGQPQTDTVIHPASPGTERDAWIVQRCLAYIRNNINRTLCVKDLSGALHVSESSVYKAFARVLSRSPNDTVLRIKVKQAEKLLKSTTLSCAEIADHLAFSSPFYFSTVFKRFYGMSPRNYLDLLAGQTCPPKHQVE
jgi:AraC-like DNA-binding protein